MSFTRTFSTLNKKQRIAVKLNVKGERSVLSKHPWVFSDSIIKTNKEPQTGDLAIIFGKNKNKIIGFGFFDLASPIRIKMIHHGDAIAIDETFFHHKISEAFAKRTSLLKTNTNSYRLIFGENDGFPGLIADVYASVLVVKLYSEIWINDLQAILESLISVSNCETVVIRLSRGLQQSQAHDLKDGEVVYGVLENEVVEFVEHGVHFSANVIHGHKTGYFLDHRLNRKQVGAWSKGKSVLDVFSYAGGFSVHALANQAKEVTSLDISKQALEMAVANGKLNKYTGKHKTIAGDAFAEMKQLIKDNITFDVVVIDPPSFAKQQSEIDLAKKKYAQLARLGLKLTAKKGLLVLASCSSRVLAQTFFDINAQVLRESNRNYQIILKTEHDTDHPIGFAEGAYLKCAYYRLD
ncbi:class I SAM-dependent rRNA methyltransferase [Oceanihabitans sediminis]|uniref:Class I SAM-dependent rRNA methyltransferase n=1 Tax=Oceanihabitans sediminis TaxID=1812012 RepID=A0A368P3F2_9FLAO|nr:class I SAM-dependent rRNA methyltransferase [Oceanihabitans sediminis]MDX1277229.1 class I SAM-dependent rRNA methyltransferase [Oceanihabitans sediminis]RBP33092.1 23S rRNA (cytosine1962-C5)-methyltransferase [Oceanihabitans sediminis]RCU57397.1 class I SAM-dependent rRNA methyltransferase [Oceanihabitans sediminis]